MKVFHNQRRELATIVRQRSFRQEAAMALSAFDCFTHGEKVPYASSELTTGRRCYDLMRAHGAQDSQHLRRQMGNAAYQQALWQPNAEAANAFARTLSRRLQECVITPAPFTAPGWSQHEYLAFWEQLIRTRARCVYFNSGWQYSNGCTYELTVATHAGVPTFDAAGTALSAEAGAQLIAAAIAELEAEGFAPTALISHRAALSRLAARNAAGG